MGTNYLNDSYIDLNDKKLENLEEINKSLKEQIQMNKIYLAIISRYTDYIEEKENISVVELPKYITPKDEKIVEKANEIKALFESYVYEKDFYAASSTAYEFVKNEIEEINIPIEFWFYPIEIIEFKAGDIMDKNILLSSLLISLGNPSTKVLVTINENKRDIFSYYEFNDKVYRFDFKEGLKIFENKEQMINSLLINNDTISYEFNDNIYFNIH